MPEEERRHLAGIMVRQLPRYGRWAQSVRDYRTPFGKIGFRQLGILWILRFGLIPGDDISPSNFAVFLGVQPSVITRGLAKLEAQGFVARSVDPSDGRRFRITITESGIAVSNHVEELFLQELVGGTDALDDATIVELTRTVTILGDVMDRIEDQRRCRAEHA